MTKESPHWLGPTGKTFDFPPSRLAGNASLEAINKGRTIKEKSFYKQEKFFFIFTSCWKTYILAVKSVSHLQL